MSTLNFKDGRFFLLDGDKLIFDGGRHAFDYAREQFDMNKIVARLNYLLYGGDAI